MTNQDRCDRCSAQALLRVMFLSGDLLFCGHHYDDHHEAFPVSESGEPLFAILEDVRKELAHA